ncbi:MAG: DUF3427 domain-containing protein [Deltaproteobacteria bacterium]|nr:DUF3427 domain-containing protein [Deltaproteobacteria bacterium]
MPTKLIPGLYEDLITTDLASKVTEAREQGWLIEDARCEPELRAELLAQHIYHHALRVLRDKKGKSADVLRDQVKLTNRLLAVLEKHKRPVVTSGDRVEKVPEILREARPKPKEALATLGCTPRPSLSLRSSGLMVNGHHDYQIGHEVAREAESADRIDLLCAFVRFAGLRLVLPQLRAFVKRGGDLRVITSVYTGSTEKKALDALHELGAKVKVSYETAQTRLHAKAWLFERHTGLSTAYIGSSNLTHSALVDGLEWNVRLTAADNEPLLERFRATFDQYWESEEFAPYAPDRDGERLASALEKERAPRGDGWAPFDLLASLSIDVAPKPHQAEVLEALQAERSRGHHRNLVVAATGTGKTWIAAFDYARLREQGYEKLLFVAHREEILRQSQQVFRVVLADGQFGGQLVGGQRPADGRHVFASIQSLKNQLEDLRADEFDVVIVDEFHHAAAKTYRELLEHLEPSVLLGLTATPERMDGKSILEWFDNRIASESRLWNALDEGLLCPFHYFGVADGTDLSGVTFSQGRYSQGELEDIYTGDDIRLKRILQAVDRYTANTGQMRALGFCVGVENAKFMAERFRKAGLPSVALHGGSSKQERVSAIQKLRSGALRCIFTVDLFNEGVDIPEVDTVLMLRPTESATVFLQQLGRGLRWARNKSVLTVLDFVGHAHSDFRFDLRFRALVGGTRREVAKAVEAGFPLLPPGCAIQLEREAQDAILENLRSAIQNLRAQLVDDLKALGPDSGLREFLRRSEKDLQDVYTRPSSNHCFTDLHRRAGHLPREKSDQEKALERYAGRALHIDDPVRLNAWLSWLANKKPLSVKPLNTRQGRLLAMLYATLGHRKRPIVEMVATFQELWSTPQLKREFVDLFEILADASRVDAQPLDPKGRVPLCSHASYSLYEAIAAYGLVGPESGALRETREGIVWADEDKTGLLFITLDKSESDYSPTTRYADYPISPELFHWETQNSTTPSSNVGKRYIEHRYCGTRIVLFVRQRKKDDRGETMPYTCLGYANYVTHESERPMRITWKLERPMPAWLYQAGKLAAA